MLLIKQKNWQKKEHIHRKYSLYKKFIFLSLKSDIKVEQKEASIEESLLKQCDFSFQSMIVPITIGGRIFTFIILMIGLGIIAIPSGMISSALTEARELEKN
mgnify:CR=1 FL=1